MKQVVLWSGTLLCGLAGYIAHINGGWGQVLKFGTVYKTIYQTNTIVMYDYRDTRTPLKIEPQAHPGWYFTNGPDTLYVTNLYVTNWFQ